MNKEIFKTIWGSNVFILLKRLGLIYLALFICRVVFYIYNSAIIGAIELNEVWQLLKGATQFDTVSIIYAFGPLILLSVLPFKFIEKSWWQKIIKWYSIVVAALVIAVNLSDIVYFRYTQSRFTAGDVFFADNSNTALLIGQFAAENWYLIALWVALVSMIFYGWRLCGAPKSRIENKWAYLIVHTISMALVITATIWAVRGGSLSRYTRPITLSNALSYTNSSAKATMILSNPFSIFRSTGNNEFVDKQYFSEEELNKIFTPIHKIDTTQVNQDYFGSMKGKNVFIFVLESFSAELSGYLNPDIYPNGNGYTPFLDSLMMNGFVMKHGYANGKKSIEGLPSVLSSIPSFKTPFVLMPASLGEGKQLPKYMVDMGYETAFFCGSPRGSMGFEAYAKSAGVENFYSMAEFNQTREDAYDGYWGLWDEEFFDYTGEVLSQMQEPFMGTLFSISSHHPFNVPERYKSVLPKGEARIHQPAAYTDMSLRKFFDKYSNDEWFKNTLFVFVADHVSSEVHIEKSKTLRGKQQIITTFYTPDGSLSGEYNSVFQQLDIMPTLLGLLGNEEPYYSFGRDIFNEPNRKPMVFNYRGTFLASSDSLSVIYNDQTDKVIGAYHMNDTLMERDLLPTENGEITDNEKLLKAVIQQYYNSLRKREYKVKSN